MTEPPSPPPDEQVRDVPVGHTVDRLSPALGGVWLVATHRDTTHVWDLDAMTYRRQPGPGSTPMEYDDRTVPIGRVEAWPQVGTRSLVWFDDPEDDQLEHWRICSRIRSITRRS